MRAHLEGQGIIAFVRDAHTAANYGEAVIGGCRLEVMADQAEQAQSILEPSFHDSPAESDSVKNVFRVKANKAPTYVLYASLLVAALFVTSTLFNLMDTQRTFYLSLSILLGVSIFGRFQRDDYCSSCRNQLELSASICGGCHGVIQGEIDHPNERLDAEEKLKQESR